MPRKPPRGPAAAAGGKRGREEAAVAGADDGSGRHTVIKVTLRPFLTGSRKRVTRVVELLSELSASCSRAMHLCGILFNFVLLICLKFNFALPSLLSDTTFCQCMRPDVNLRKPVPQVRTTISNSFSPG
jgi:hypothetical protein